MTTRWAWTWTGSTLVWIVFTMSDLIGVPVVRLLSHLDLIVIVAGTNRVLGESATLWVALAVGHVRRASGEGLAGGRSTAGGIGRHVADRAHRPCQSSLLADGGVGGTGRSMS